MDAPSIERLRHIEREILITYKEHHSYKAKGFVGSLPDLLFTLFGYSHSIGFIEGVQMEEDEASGNLRKRVTKLIQRKSFETPYNVLIDILSPGSRSSLFSLVNESFMASEFMIKIDDLPLHTSRAWRANNKGDPILQRYHLMLDYRQQSESQGVIVSTSELFMISFLQSFINSSPSLCYRAKVDEPGSIESNLKSNIYLILLRRYLEFLFNENKKLFCKFMFFIEDYLLNEFVNGSRHITSFHGKSSSQSDSTIFSKPQLLDGIYLFLHYHQKSSDVFGLNVTLTQRQAEEAEENRKRVDDLFFSFFKEFLFIWNSNFSASSPMLADIGRVWLKFVTPGLILDPSNIVDNIADVGVRENWLNRRMEIMNLTRHEISSSMNLFIQNHLHFYHELFLSFLSSFSNLTIFGIKEISVLKEMLS